MLILEGAQAGLSWETILRKRENYRKAFAGFDPAKVARFTPARIEKLLLDPGLVRNRLKIESAVKNARAFLAIQKEFGSFDAYVWPFVGNRPINGKRKSSRRRPRENCGERCAFERSAEAWIQLRRQHDYLRLHAGRRLGERSHHRLLPLRPHVNLDPRRGRIEFGALHIAGVGELTLPVRESIIERIRADDQRYAW